MHYQKILLSSLLVGMLSLTACGSGNNISIKGVDLSTSQVTSDTYVNMDAIITMGNLKFPNVEVPIFNPKNMEVLGQLDLESLADGTNRLAVSVDFTTITKLNSALGTTLPNGRELPLSLDLGNTQLIGIPIMTNSIIYVGGELDGTAVIGAAIAIPAFDSVLGKVPTPLNIFATYPFSTVISATGGFFTSPNAGGNGVAVFVKRIAPTSSSSVETTLGSTNGDSTNATTMVARTQTKKIGRMSVESASVPIAADVTHTAPTELDRVDTMTMYKFGNLLNKRATLKVK